MERGVIVKKEDKAAHLADAVAADYGLPADNVGGDIERPDGDAGGTERPAGGGGVNAVHAARRGFDGLEPALVRFGGDHWRLSADEKRDLEDAMSQAYPMLDPGKYAKHYFWLLCLWIFGPRLARTVWEKFGQQIVSGMMQAEAAKQGGRPGTEGGDVAIDEIDPDGQRGGDGSDGNGEESTLSADR